MRLIGWLHALVRDRFDRGLRYISVGYPSNRRPICGITARTARLSQLEQLELEAAHLLRPRRGRSLRGLELCGELVTIGLGPLRAPPQILVALLTLVDDLLVRAEFRECLGRARLELE